MPLQREAVQYLNDRMAIGLGGFLFLEMRLGKTLAMIRFLKQSGIKRPYLIICPNSVISTWLNELAAEGERSVLVVEGTRTRKEARMAAEADWYVVNFESAVPSRRKDKETGSVKVTRKGLELHHYNWGAVVIDESVRLGNPGSSTTRYLVNHFARFEFKYELCGMPCPESELQFVPQFLFVQKTFMGFRNFWSFRLAKYVQAGYGWIPKPGTKAEIYHFVHANAFIRTRAQAGVGSKKFYQVRDVEMSEAQRKAHKEVLKGFEYDGHQTKYAVTQAGWLNKIAGGYHPAYGEDVDKEPPVGVDPWLSRAKFKELVYLLTGELKGEQVLVWCRFKHEWTELLRVIREAGISCEGVRGSVDRDEREEIRRRFMAGKFKVAVATIKSMKQGTDWSAADTAVYFSNEYGGDPRAQSEDRIVSQFKKKPLLIIDLKTKGSTDEDVLDALNYKGENSQMFMSRLLANIAKRKQTLFQKAAVK